MMKLGTATITLYRNPRHEPLWFVEWLNVGSFLQNEPRAFLTEADARQFCRQRGLRVAS